MTKTPTKIDFSHDKVVPLDDYYMDSEIMFLCAISYEERGFESLKRAVEKCGVKKVLLVQFNVGEYLDPKTRRTWEREKNRVLSFLAERNIPYELICALDHNFGDVFTNIENEISHGDTLVVDITTFPKNYILKLCMELESYHTIYQYTRGERYADLTEEERRVGISKIIPVDGFEGRILLNESALVILILGFEGSRALPFLEEFPSSRTLALVGAPGIGMRKASAKDKEFIRLSEQSNKRLLNNSFVKKIKVNSLEAFLFCRQLKNTVHENLGISERANIIVVPIGTKAQTLGLYLYWRENPEIQILYPLPNRRPLIALKTGKTFMYDFSNP